MSSGQDSQQPKKEDAADEAKRQRETSRELMRSIDVLKEKIAANLRKLKELLKEKNEYGKTDKDEN